MSDQEMTSKAHAMLQEAFPGIEEHRGQVPVARTFSDRLADLHARFRANVITDHLAVARAKGCSHPIRLSGSLKVCDESTGEVVHQWSTEADTNDSSVAVPCKTRRAARCESCAALYQGDAFKLIAEGLRGGDHVEASVKDHPALFVTFTAPGFGPVHTQRRNSNGNIAPCRPRRDGEICEHGNDLSCTKRHSDDDPLLGQAISSCCFDYDAAVLWNHHAGKLWRSTRIAIDRQLADQLGVSVKEMKDDHCKTQYVKIAEFQARGLVHFHVAIRLDGPGVTVQDLIEVVTHAHQSSSAKCQDNERISWGSQLDIKIIGTDIERGKLAGYFAKYATKGADALGLLHSRIRSEGHIDNLSITNHQANLVRASWKLANRYPDLNLQRWAHQFGFGGHFLTKSLSWSTTFKALRQKRADHNMEVQKLSWQALAPKAQLIIEARWDYAGRGYANPRQAHYAAMQQADQPITADEQAA